MLLRRGSGSRSRAQLRRGVRDPPLHRHLALFHLGSGAIRRLRAASTGCRPPAPVRSTGPVAQLSHWVRRREGQESGRRGGRRRGQFGRGGSDTREESGLMSRSGGPPGCSGRRRSGRSQRASEGASSPPAGTPSSSGVPIRRCSRRGRPDGIVVPRRDGLGGVLRETVGGPPRASPKAGLALVAVAGLDARPDGGARRSALPRRRPAWRRRAAINHHDPVRQDACRDRRTCRRAGHLDDVRPPALTAPTITPDRARQLARAPTGLRGSRYHSLSRMETTHRCPPSR